MNTITKNLIKGVAIGLIASFIKSLAEPPLQKIGETLLPPEDDELKLRGADVTRQPENMPPAVFAKEMYRKIAHTELSYSGTLKSMKIIHYTLGTLIGVSYIFMTEKNKNFTAGQGIAAGITVWALTHGSTVPALKLQGKVSDMPKSWWIWEFGSHVVFGVSMEQMRKVLHYYFR